MKRQSQRVGESAEMGTINGLTTSSNFLNASLRSTYLCKRLNWLGVAITLIYLHVYVSYPPNSVILFSIILSIS